MNNYLIGLYEDEYIVNADGQNEEGLYFEYDHGCWHSEVGVDAD